MTRLSPGRRTMLCLAFALFFLAGTLRPQIAVTNDPPQYGPYNGVFLLGGDGLRESLVANDTVLRADSPWSLFCWVRMDQSPEKPTLVAGVGETTEEYPRYLSVDAQSLTLWMGKDNSLTGRATWTLGKWQLLAATFDGREFHLYSDGEQVAGGKLLLGTVGPILQMAPPVLPTAAGEHFGGKIASLVLQRQALDAQEIKQLYAKPPDFSLATFDEGSKSWPVQTRGQAGYRAPQDPSTLPISKAPFSKPMAHNSASSRAALDGRGENEWAIAGNWQLKPAPEVKADGVRISQPGFDTAGWLQATVPGTVLTTLVDRGVYPDPEYGLNNLAIPESLNKQDYWYRAHLTSPEGLGKRHLTLTFEGINYKAVVWLNGQRLGTITGAFIRGNFDVTQIWKAGRGEENTLAVKVSPPPHPGIPQEQSIKGGPGENGGIMCLDGPTFIASEGWDWIPGVRDRETGIWQPVVLRATNIVKIGDPQVVTTLPLPDTSRADVQIDVALENLSAQPVQGTLKASFEAVSVSKQVSLAPGRTSVKLAPSEFQQLTVQNPRLWWPNGYGKQELYHLKLVFEEANQPSDVKQVRFGIREITYELSLLDSAGRLRRVEVDPTLAKIRNEEIVDVSHEGMREIPPADPIPPDIPENRRGFFHSWVASLTPGAENSPAVRTSDDLKTAPYLVLKVNGVKIACRGGSWGMDDFMKRVSRERLEPFFRLHRDAHLNMIRNWVGQNTEEVFYDLADEYGLLIWNDFWATTQNYNVEPEDPELFLANARDTILRFRNHPSIVVWCGRNEGVPQPVLNKGLAELITSLDGTRYYSPSSNQVNLQNSGPYKYMDPKLYFSRLNRGFSVETGTPSMSTLESFQSSIPKEDQWPIDDVWAYHDWHHSGNGDVAPFMAEMQAELGAPTSLEDFDRKAQMIDYVSHRAIFEGMNAHLWAPNSGRMLWMTQPAWPSTMWQIFSHDYDTQASYFGVQKACEPVHIQLDLSNYEVAVVNTTRQPQPGLSLAATVFSLDNKTLFHHEEQRDASPDTLTDGFRLDLAPFFSSDVVLVKLELHNSGGQVVSQNLYWLSAETSSYRELVRLPLADVSAIAVSKRSGDKVSIHVQLQNRGNTASLEEKLTLLNANDGSRVLPAYFSDNYVSLLPGETREVEIEYPAAVQKGPMQLAVRGWNLAREKISVAEDK